MTPGVRRLVFIGTIVVVGFALVHSGFLTAVIKNADSVSPLADLHLGHLTTEVKAAAETAESIHYSPTENLERPDIAALNGIGGDGCHLDVAMYSFTDHHLADAVLDVAKRGCQVRVYRDHDQYEEERDRGDSYVDDVLASNENIKVREKADKELMHLKAFSDGNFLRDGSANWSIGGEKYQDNSIEIRADKVAVARFERQFEAMWNRPDNINR